MADLSGPLQRALAAAAFLQFLFCVLIAVVIPKATTISLAILMVGSLFVVLLQVPVRSIRMSAPPNWLFAMMVLPSLVAISSLWSEDPGAAYMAAICLAFVIIAYGVVANCSSLLPQVVQRGCQYGFMLGVSVAVVIAAIDVASGEGISRWVFSTWPNLPEASTSHVAFEDGKAIFVSVATPNRRAIVLVCLLPAFVYCVVKLRDLVPLAFIAVPGLVGYAVLMMATFSLTSQVAVVVGGIVFAAAIYLPRVIHVWLVSAWVAIWLLVVPGVFVMAYLGLDKSHWLPPSAAERVEIWAGVARDVLDKPLFGDAVGSEVYKDVSSEERSGSGSMRLRAHHPHNGFLQIWHELGAVGVLVVLSLGVWVIGQIKLLTNSIRPYFYGLFGGCIAIIATGYGIWQHWHLSALALGAAILWIVTRNDHIDEQSRTL